MEKHGRIIGNDPPFLTANARPSTSSAPIVKQEPQQLTFSVKPEPIDTFLASSFGLDVKRNDLNSPLTTSSPPSQTPDADSAPSDGQDGLNFNTSPLSAVPAPPKPTLTMYSAPHEIVYTPEQALEQGLAMVEMVKESIASLLVANKMRQEVWNRDLQRLQNTGTQKTMIALCGATGAGKSSVINALLKDNIVPTSGMRACTATVTEIAYHDRSTIDADIGFLSKEEWRTELAVLQDDMTDEDGNAKRSSEMRNDAGVAWHKVHAVYPALTAEELIRMTADEIIASDPKIAKILDTTKHLGCRDSKEFGKEINKYIDSKNQKRGDKKDKKKNKEKDEPAYWPLIKQVKVWVKADALSTGAVLCDLPGTADSNAARSSIAKEYMKIANCVWILAPIHRAVDDKTARDLLGDAFKTQLLMDGNYDGSTVTFIATKADDVAASEIVRALDLGDEPELVALEEKIDNFEAERKESKKLKESATVEITSLNKQLDRNKAIRSELEDHLRCLKSGKKFTPRLTAKKKRQQHGGNPKKRKSIATGGKSRTKRRKSSSDDSDESSDEEIESGTDNDSFVVSDGESDELEDSDMKSSEDERAKKKSKRSKSKKSRPRKSTPSSSEDLTSDESNESDSDSDDSGHKSRRKSKSKSKSKSHGKSKKSKKSKKHSRHGSTDSEDDDSDAESTDGDDVAETEASLKSKIAAEKAEVERLRSRISELKVQKSEAGSNLAKAKKKLVSVQKEKNAFCAIKRAEYSRDVLKVDFRTGLRDLDESAALERDAESFDPSMALRDYDAIDLPVYCVSARDYARIHKMNRGDGESSTFSGDAQTEIPALRAWCKHLTVATRERTVRVFLDTIKAFVQSIMSYVEGLDGISNAERESLRSKWQTPPAPDSEFESDGDDLYGWIEDSDGGYTKQKHAKFPIKDSKGNLIGICPRLYSEFEVLVEDTVDELKERFKDGLESKCTEGVALAKRSALEISDDLAQGIHWLTYRATLRRDGTFRQDLNELLCMPLTKRVATSWAQVFEANLFASIDSRVLSGIKDLLTWMEKSTKSTGLKEKCTSQGELALEEAKIELSKLVAAVSESLQSQQKDISRCIAPTVKEALHPGYLTAAMERGRGSVARQKASFRDYLKNARDDIFEGCSTTLFSLLDGASAKVEEQLDAALKNLAQKVEVNLSVLWEGANDTPEQKIARVNTRKVMLEISRQIIMWQQAARGLGMSV